MFRFKQFVVHQDRCAMKVGTDGVLLGAWADCNQAQHILDIGTGTGLIALMLAQRTNNSALIDAIEIDLEATQQAQENVQQSLWNSRIIVHNSALQLFAQSAYASKKYDIVVSNPPFFVNSLISSSFQRSIARHNIQLSFETLLYHVAHLLLPQGRFSTILPYSEAHKFIALAKLEQLYVHRYCEVAAYMGKSPKRVLLTLAPTILQPNTEPLKQVLYLYTHKDSQTYTKEYQELTANFYL